MNHRCGFWSTVSRALRSSAFALLVLIHFSAVSFGADVVSACLAKKPATGTFAISPLQVRAERADAFGWSNLLSGKTQPGHGPQRLIMAFDGGGGSGGGGGGSSTPPCEEISDISTWVDASVQDRDPPILSGLLPESGAQVQSTTFTLSLSAVDASPLAFRVVVDHEWLYCQTTQFYNPVTHTFTLSAPVEMTPVHMHFAPPLGYALLAQGHRELEIEVFDKAGNRTTLVTTYNVADPGTQMALAAVQSYVDAVNQNIPEAERGPLLADANLLRVIADEGVSTFEDIAAAIQQYLDATEGWSGSAGGTQFLSPQDLQTNRQEWINVHDVLMNLVIRDPIGNLVPWGEIIAGGFVSGGIIAIGVGGVVVAGAAQAKANQAAGHGDCWAALAWRAAGCIVGGGLIGLAGHVARAAVATTGPIGWGAFAAGAVICLLIACVDDYFDPHNQCPLCMGG